MDINDRLLEPIRMRGNREKGENAQIIYNILDYDKYVMIGGTIFYPSWDSTDHFSFICGGCHSVADVVKVFFINKERYDKDALFLYLECRECHATGKRKIYFGPKEEAYCQIAFIDPNILLYFDSNKPDTTVETHRTTGPLMSGVNNNEKC